MIGWQPKGAVWSLLRNRLCALTSAGGGYGFTCGVEWLAPERINVHSARGLRWGNPEHIVEELGRLNRLLAEHPCFLDGARLTRLSPSESSVVALRRDAAETGESLLVLANTDLARTQKLSLDLAALNSTVSRASGEDLLGQRTPRWRVSPKGRVEFTLQPAAVHCLEMANPAKPVRPAASPPATTAPAPQAVVLPVSPYRQARARAAWAVQALAEILPPEEIGPYEWRRLSDLVDRDPGRFLAALPVLDRVLAANDLVGAIEKAAASHPFPAVVPWSLADRTRITVVPGTHWLLVRDSSPFRASLSLSNASVRHVQSIAAVGGHLACFPPAPVSGAATLQLERYDSEPARVEAGLRYVECDLPSGAGAAGQPSTAGPVVGSCRPAGSGVPRAAETPAPEALVLLTNGRGGMARLCVDLGRVTSKYDCLLGANLHPTVPVDRHVLAKRLRAWVVADGFITPLNRDNLVEFVPGPPALWRFVANAGDGRAVELHLVAEMIEGCNATRLQWRRSDSAPPLGRALPRECSVSLTVRVDIEDRNFHSETHRNDGSDFHFSSHCRPEGIGFAFTPAPDRELRVFCDRGAYHHEAEWCEHIPHPVEATRGLVAEGDAYSPGWFEIPLGAGDTATLMVTADPRGEPPRLGSRPAGPKPGPAEAEEPLDQRLARAARAFVVRRGSGRTVIAGYPWFLDWGRDTLIAARGLLAAGLRDEVREILQTFGRFEKDGTLPNAVFGDNASNRDTTDAPLWYGLACEEMAALEAGPAGASTRPPRRPVPPASMRPWLARGPVRSRTFWPRLRSTISKALRMASAWIRSQA